LDEGQNGLFVPLRDGPAIASAIAGLFADSALSRGLGSAAREKAQARFSIKSTVSAYCRLFDEVLGEKGAAWSR
jgi:glycosyltransferase involved in cell wall biosynthesis